MDEISRWYVNIHTRALELLTRSSSLIINFIPKCTVLVFSTLFRDESYIMHFFPSLCFHSLCVPNITKISYSKVNEGYKKAQRKGKISRK